MKGTDTPIEKVTWAVSGTRSLDPAHAFDGASYKVIQAILEPLIATGSDGKLVPALATDWTQEDRVIDFQLREGVTFWNGDPLTADDVAFSLRRLIDPETAAEMASYFANVKSVETTGPHSVRVELKETDSDFISVVPLALIIQEKHALAAGEDLGGPDALIQGTGAFEPVEYSPTTGAVLERFDGYWGAKPTVENLEIEVIADPQARKLALSSGAIDGTFEVPFDDAASWENLSDVRVVWGPATTVSLLVLNTETPPFNDVHARRAMAHLVDTEGIASAIFSGHARKAKTIVAPEAWAAIADQAEVDAFYDTLPDIELNIDAAKEELAKSNTPDGFELTVLVPDSHLPSVRTVQVIAADAAEVGITIDVKRVPIGEFLEELTSKESPLVSTAFDSVAPNTMLAPLAYSSSPDRPGRFSDFSNQDLEEAFAAYRDGDRAAKFEATKSVYEILSDEMPTVPLVVWEQPLALASTLAYTAPLTGWVAFGGSNWATYIKEAA